MSSYQYRKSHCGDKKILRASYLHNGISYTGKMTSLYWIRTQGPPPRISLSSGKDKRSHVWEENVLEPMFICQKHHQRILNIVPPLGSWVTGEGRGPRGWQDGISQWNLLISIRFINVSSPLRHQSLVYDRCSLRQVKFFISNQIKSCTCKRSKFGVDIMQITMD